MLIVAPAGVQTQALRCFEHLTAVFVNKLYLVLGIYGVLAPAVTSSLVSQTFELVFEGFNELMRGRYEIVMLV